MMDFLSCTPEELDNLIKQARDAKRSFELRQRQGSLSDLVDEFVDRADELNFKVRDLLRELRIRTKAYVNPDNPTQTWTGLGKKPAWLVEKLAEGYELDAFLAKKDDKDEPDAEGE